MTHFHLQSPLIFSSGKDFAETSMIFPAPNPKGKIFVQISLEDPIKSVIP